MSKRGDGEDDNFLRRWSRLKSKDAPGRPGPDEEKALAPADDAAAPESDEGAQDEAALADLPDIDSLDKDSDYTVFLRDGVPEALRQRALRKLWLSDPVFANLDGLNEYDEDFGAIYREGAAVMKRLADAGERMTRPGAEDESPEAPDGEGAVEEVVEEDPAASESVQDPDKA